MTNHTMPILTDSEREELIKQANSLMVSTPFHAVAQIALAALTSKVEASKTRLVNYRANVEHPWTVSLGEKKESKGDIFKVEVEHLYTAPPVPALKLPDEMSVNDFEHPIDRQEAFMHRATAWNACITEVKRLNGVTK